MANHVSAEKRARQSLKRKARNAGIRSQVQVAVRAAKEAPIAKAEDAVAILGRAFSVVQKSRGVLHKNTIKRKMSRLAKALAKKTSVAKA